MVIAMQKRDDILVAMPIEKPTRSVSNKMAGLVIVCGAPGTCYTRRRNLIPTRHDVHVTLKLTATKYRVEPPIRASHKEGDEDPNA